jgi:predicted dehydrogenase
MSKNTTRRDFIKQGAVAAGTVATFGTAPTYIKASVFGANDKMQLGFIGVGGRGRSLLRDFATAGQTHPLNILAVCDTYKKRLTQAGEALQRFNQPKPEMATLDYREIIARKDIDAVVIATPDHWHAPIAIAAMQAGKDVYCEKPMTKSLSKNTD